MTDEDRETAQLAQLAIAADQNRIITVYAADGTQLASYDYDPAAPYIQIYPENTSDEPIFTVRTKEDFDAMVDAVRRLADLREWLKEHTENRRVFSDRLRAEVYEKVLDRLNEESGQQ